MENCIELKGSEIAYLFIAKDYYIVGLRPNHKLLAQLKYCEAPSYYIRSLAERSLLPVIDVQHLPEQSVYAASMHFPEIADFELYGMPPWDQYSKAPLALVAELWRRIGANVRNCYELEDLSNLLKAPAESLAQGALQLAMNGQLDGTAINTSIMHRAIQIKTLPEDLHESLRLMVDRYEAAILGAHAIEKCVESFPMEVFDSLNPKLEDQIPTQMLRHYELLAAKLIFAVDAGSHEVRSSLAVELQSLMDIQKIKLDRIPVHNAYPVKIAYGAMCKLVNQVLEKLK
ncbi:hypothetical protein [Neptuniibacter sp. QD37_11]|uniref:hypothetical protein n=1 Tax=Neptuniibacter sp. QD37_11 TaxID=3398209 RepID=UPI0039F60E47